MKSGIWLLPATLLLALAFIATGCESEKKASGQTKLPVLRFG